MKNKQLIETIDDFDRSERSFKQSNGDISEITDQLLLEKMQSLNIRQKFKKLIRKQLSKTINQKYLIQSFQDNGLFVMPRDIKGDSYQEVILESIRGYNEEIYDIQNNNKQSEISQSITSSFYQSNLSSSGQITLSLKQVNNYFSFSHLFQRTRSRLNNNDDFKRECAFIRDEIIKRTEFMTFGLDILINKSVELSCVLYNRSVFFKKIENNSNLDEIIQSDIFEAENIWNDKKRLKKFLSDQKLINQNNQKIQSFIHETQFKHSQSNFIQSFINDGIGENQYRMSRNFLEINQNNHFICQLMKREKSYYIITAKKKKNAKKIMVKEYPISLNPNLDASLSIANCPLSGRFFIYDNLGKIHIFSRKPTYNGLNQCDQSQSLLEIQLKDQYLTFRQKPSLLVHNLTKEHTILIVAGGYLKQNNSTVKKPLTSIKIFKISARNISINHFLEIQMKFARMAPLLLNFHNLDQSISDIDIISPSQGLGHLIIVGGNSMSELVPNLARDSEEKQKFMNSNEFCEYIPWSEIMQHIFRRESKKIEIKHSLKIKLESVKPKEMKEMNKGSVYSWKIDGWRNRYFIIGHYEDSVIEIQVIAFSEKEIIFTPAEFKLPKKCLLYQTYVHVNSVSLLYFSNYDNCDINQIDLKLFNTGQLEIETYILPKSPELELIEKKNLQTITTLQTIHHKQNSKCSELCNII